MRSILPMYRYSAYRKKQKSHLEYLKRGILNFLIFIFVSLIYFKKFLLFLLKILGGPTRLTGKIFFLFLLLPFYRFLLFIKKRGLDLFLRIKNQKCLPLISSSFYSRILFVFLTFLVVGNSIGARGIRSEEFGKRTLLFTLTGIAEEEIIEEAPSPKVSQPLLKTYPAKLAALGAPPQRERTQSIPEIPLSSITQGGSALIKPQILEPEGPKTRTQIVFYIVQGGETVTSIAEKFGIPVNTILWENKLGPRTLIRPGDKLTILPTAGVTHKVKKGETLGQIATRYQVKEEDIIAFNDLRDPRHISINQKLIIPGGRPLPEPRPRLAFVREIFTPRVAPREGKLLWPTTSRRINQYFTWRHHGLDIDGTYSSPIYAAEAGRVEFAAWRGGYGLCLILNHGGNLKTLYGHASKIFVRVGEKVSQGQTLGMIGTTGRSTGTHLHFEIIIGGNKVNPLSHL